MQSPAAEPQERKNELVVVAVRQSLTALRAAEPREPEDIKFQDFRFQRPLEFQNRCQKPPFNSGFGDR
jgi:hypothetical protein